MTIVLSEHVLSELESLLAEVKHEIAQREAALASSELPEASSASSAAAVGSVSAPTPQPLETADTSAAQATPPPAARSGTLKRPPRTPSAPASASTSAPVSAPTSADTEDEIASTSALAAAPADAPPPAATESEPALDATPAPTIRYVHPASRTLTWTGEGNTPEWITAYLAHGGSWTAMENAAEKLAASHRRDVRLMSTRTPSAKRNR